MSARRWWSPQSRVDSSVPEVSLHPQVYLPPCPKPVLLTRGLVRGRREENCSWRCQRGRPIHSTVGVHHLPTSLLWFIRAEWGAVLIGPIWTGSLRHYSSQPHSKLKEKKHFSSSLPPTPFVRVNNHNNKGKEKNYFVCNRKVGGGTWNQGAVYLLWASNWTRQRGQGVSRCSPAQHCLPVMAIKAYGQSLQKSPIATHSLRYIRPEFSPLPTGHSCLCRGAATQHPTATNTR